MCEFECLAQEIKESPHYQLGYVLSCLERVYKMLKIKEDDSYIKLVVGRISSTLTHIEECQGNKK